jgi:non-specific serine/threonine protein kinase
MLGTHPEAGALYSAGAMSQPPRLPADPSSLIGRAPDISRTRDLLLRPDVRLVTLTGPAGTGKTRLAVAVAREVLAAFADGACFVDLAPLSEPGQVAGAIARALDVREVGDESLLDSLKQLLTGRDLLLVLDNFEHLLDAALDIATLLDACPGLKVLATSRERLHLRWEQELAVPPLIVPDLQHLPSLAELLEVPAVALFLRRAQALRPEFRLDAEDAQAVAELCVRLDGLPLAIELAAARTRVLTPSAILARLDDRLDLLRMEVRDAPRRHQALREAIRWSYELLSADEQSLFCRLAVFVGGCTLDAAATVCGATLDQLTSLLDKSLLQLRLVEHPDTEARFQMLETIRIYALEQLAAHAEADATQRRHATYFVELAERAEADLWGPAIGRCLIRLDREHANIRAALRRLMAWGDVPAAERLAAAVGTAWQGGGRLTEGRSWLADLLAAPDSSSRPWMRAKLLMIAGSLAVTHGDLAAASPLFEEGLCLARAGEDPALVAWALVNLGYLALVAGELASARQLLEEGAAVSRGGNLPGWEAFNLRQLGFVAVEAGDDATARPLFERALLLATEAGYIRALAFAQLSLGWLCYRAGEQTNAQAHLEASLQHWEAMREPASSAATATVVAGLGHLAVDRDEPERARALFTELLTHAHPPGGQYVLRLALEGFAHLAAQQGQAAPALRLASAATRLQRSHAGRGSVRGSPLLERWIAPARAAAGSRTAVSAWNAGAAFSTAEAVAAARAVGAAISQATAPSSPLDLTPREREVVVLVAEGLTNRQIAERLVVGDRTVESHVRSALGKLGFRSRYQLAEWAMQHGLATSIT